MKKKFYILPFLLLLFSSLSFAQISIPYATDFEPADQTTWTQYRTGLNHSFDWGFTSSSPYLLRHDYPVGNMSGDTVRDWMVSSAINFHSSSKLDIRAKVFTFIDVGSNDYLGVWFSSGSKDPADGDYVEIVDLTNLTPDDEWKDTLGIEIPYTSNNAYLAIRYETVSNWFVISVDSLRITPDIVLSNKAPDELSSSIELFPNPVNSNFTIKTNLVQSGRIRINLLDATGRIVRVIQPEKTVTGNYQESFFVEDIKPGFYLVDVRINEKSTTKKMVLLE